MKSYINPQPHAVEKADKNPNKPSNLAGSKQKKKTTPEAKKSTQKF